MNTSVWIMVIMFVGAGKSVESPNAWWRTEHACTVEANKIYSLMKPTHHYIPYIVCIKADGAN